MDNTALPRIAIVTPSLNQAEYLEECIDSVLGQGYPNLEYVIMDGGSSDGSVEIIKKYEKYLTYWQTQPDGGHYQAVSAGFCHTSGEIMAWLNADDKYHPLAFAKVAGAFTLNPPVRWLTGRMCYWDKAGDLVRINETLPVFSRLKYLEVHFDKPYIQQESTFWHRSLWNEAGATLGNEKLAGDLALWNRFFRYDVLYTLDACLGGYRHYGDQRGIVQADAYHDEAYEIIAQERLLPRHEWLPVPPPVAVAKEWLAAFLADNGTAMSSPSLRLCWRHYTENLIGLVNGMYRERDYRLASFLRDELMLLGMVKPSAITLTADRFAEIADRQQRLAVQRSRGDANVVQGKDAVAAGDYAQVLAESPYDIDTAACLLQLYWRQGLFGEALTLMSRVLAIAAHHQEFVRLAASLLADYGAAEQAAAVCDEYLTTNPHDEVVRKMRGQLPC